MNLTDDYNLIKKNYGEKMARLCRELFPTILETPGELYRILSTEFAPSRFLYDDLKIHPNAEDNFREFILSKYKEAKIQTKEEEIDIDATPKEIFEKIGYDFYECKTKKDVLQFLKYYKTNEQLCTFKSPDDRLGRCHVFWVVKKDVEDIKREDFTKPEREDLYGTSVMSIQFAKGNSNTVSIKNRYNHTIKDKNPDATFGNDLNRIYPGLKKSFEKTYGLNIEESTREFYGLFQYIQANDGKRYKYNCEDNEIYCCPNNIIIDHGEVKQLDTSQYLVFDNYVLDFKNKLLYKNDMMYDMIPDAFVQSIGKIDKIEVINNKENSSKKIIINNDIIIILNQKNQIISYTNEHVTTIGNDFLRKSKTLEEINLPNVEKIGDQFLAENHKLQNFSFPKLKEIGAYCLPISCAIKKINCPELEIIGNNFFEGNNMICEVNIPKAKVIGNYFLHGNNNLMSLSLPNVEVIGTGFLYENRILESIDLPKVKHIGNSFMTNNMAMKHISLPEVLGIGQNFISGRYSGIETFDMPKVKTIGDEFMAFNSNLRSINLPNVITIGNCFACMAGSAYSIEAEELVTVNLPNVRKIGTCFLENNNSIKYIELPNLEEIEYGALQYNAVLNSFKAPKLKLIGTCFLTANQELEELILPEVKRIGECALAGNKKLTKVEVPNLDPKSFKFLPKTLKGVIKKSKKSSYKITEFMRKLLGKKEKLKLIETKEINIKEETDEKTI